MTADCNDMSSATTNVFNFIYLCLVQKYVFSANPLYLCKHKNTKMQERQIDRVRYFNELATTCEKYFMPYISLFKPVEQGMNVLEIGCGDGGNLLPFSRKGCEVVGVDMAPSRIEVARECFRHAGAKGQFIASDIFKITELEHRFDLIICHDVLEHINDKGLFLTNVSKYLSRGGMVFMSFPAWQMPFGGHQQICHNRLLSHLPFFHLLPRPVYKAILSTAGEPQATIDELMNIKTTRCPIELFERLSRKAGFTVCNRRLYFINPHYEVKFGLRPRLLMPFIGNIPWVRNFFTTSCFYILQPGSKQAAPANRQKA